MYMNMERAIIAKRTSIYYFEQPLYLVCASRASRGRLEAMRTGVRAGCRRSAILSCIELTHMM